MFIRAPRACLFLVVFAFSILRLSAGPSLGLRADIVETRPSSNEAFPLVSAGASAPLCHDRGEFPGVVRALRDLQEDVRRVTGLRPSLGVEATSANAVVVVGTLGRNGRIDALVDSGKIDASDLRGRWESFVIQTVEHPFDGVERALVIAGSDKRGTIYGIYELSEQLGVSPWRWWADVAPQKRASAYVVPGRHASGEPAVRYRGIFLNDEAPCLTGWAREKFGGLNSKFYTKVFELLLRLRANYLWPAMWDNAFNEDDPENPRLADEYGIVMGTSHHEPMMRAHKEWTRRRSQYGNGKWNYATNAEALKGFFREGIARNKKYENLVTIGMRGDGDEGMASTGSIESDIALLERVMADQREILADETGEPPEKTPQLWALFTEVQKFYEKGLKVPDDVTLLWTDDNTGNLRRLPTPEERKRSGGSGIYYHFDMHGGPYAYQWINTNPIPKIWEQMNLAYRYGADRIWIVNVGDLKPLELPIEFFLRMAWDPAAMERDGLGDYLLRWAERDFGSEHAAEIADVVAKYTKYNGWRKPEIVTPETYSPLHYREAERVERAWRDVVEKAERIEAGLPEEARAAYYQLVLHPAKASALVNEMNIVAGRNRLYAKQGRQSANAEAERVRALFREDQALADYYNTKLSDGKWNHLMDQAHLGQFSWEPPRVNATPAVSEVLPADNDLYGVAVEGSVDAWPGHYGDAVLPVFDSFNPRRSYIEVFAEGTRPFEVSVSADRPWIVLSEDREPRLDRRYWVEIDWSAAPEGASDGTVTVRGKRGDVAVRLKALKATAAQKSEALGRFASLEGPISIAASDALGNRESAGALWEEIPDYGRGASALAIFPVTAPSVLPPGEAPRLDYPVYLPNGGSVEVTLVLGPVMDFVPDRGMRIAVAFDDEPPQVLDIFADREYETFLGKGWWSQFTRDNARYLRSTHRIGKPGAHTLAITMVDPGIVLQKLVIGSGRQPESYFGPPECAPVK